MTAPVLPEPGKAIVYADELRRTEMRLEGPTAEGRYFVAFYDGERNWGPMLFIPGEYEVRP